MSELLNTLYHTDNNPELYNEAEVIKDLPKEALLKLIENAGKLIMKQRRLEALASEELAGRNEQA